MGVAGVRANYLKDAVLSAEGKGEGAVLSPGVVLVYSHNFAHLLRAAHESEELRRLVRERFVVLGHFSWCPQESPRAVAEAKELHREGLLHVVMQRDAEEFFLDEGFAPHEVIPVSVGDLVDPEVFRPRGGEKDTDVVCISRMRRWKRIEILLEALSRVRERTGRALKLLVLDSARGRGADEEYAREIRSLIEQRRLGGQVEFRTVPDMDVPEVISRARVSAVCSLVEGECRAITESLFCDVPVIAMRGMRGGGVKYFTDECGILTTDGEFARDLERLLAEPGRFRPREAISRLTGMPVAWPRLERGVRRYFDARGLDFLGGLTPPDYMKLLKEGTETLTAESLRARSRRAPWREG